MLKIQLNIEETRKAIEESEKQGLDFIEVLANAIPIPDGWAMVKVQEPEVIPHEAVPSPDNDLTFDHPGN